MHDHQSHFAKIALSYQARGWIPIPIRPHDKRPLIEWRELQHRRPTEAEITAWWTRWPQANVGIVTGAISGIIALDVDEGANLRGRHMPYTPLVQTGRGRHYLFRHPGFPVPNAVRIEPGLDVRGDGGYVVAPPSIHPSGKRYEWIVSPEEVEPADPPAWLLELLRKRSGKGRWREGLQGVPEGMRNETAASLAGKLLSQLPPESWEIAWEALKAWNAKNQPPLPESELRTVFESITKRELAKRAHLRTTNQLEFPLDTMTGLAGEFAELYGSYIEAPKPFLFMGFLTYLGVLLSSRVTLDSEIEPQPRLYTVLLGESAEIRKSSALHHVDSFFREVVEDFPIHYGLGSIEGLAAELEQEGESNQALPLLLHFDELKTLVEKCKMDGSIALSMICTLFERNHFDNTTRTRRIRLRNAHLSLIAACTKETYASMWTPTFIDVGFTNRLFLVQAAGQRRFPKPRAIPRSEKLKLQTQLGEILGAINAAFRVKGEPLRLRLTEEAERLWEAFYFSLEEGVHSRRLDTYGLRLMILLSISEGNYKTVEADVVKRVVQLLDYELAVRRENDPVDAENVIARLEELIRRQLRNRGPLSKRDLRRFTHADRYGLWAFNAALRNLQSGSDIFYDRKRNLYVLPEASPKVSPHLKNAESADENNANPDSLYRGGLNLKTKLTPLSPNEHGDSSFVYGQKYGSGGMATPMATLADLNHEKPQGLDKGGDVA